MQGLNDPGVAGDKDHRTTGSSIEKAFFSVLYSMISDNDVPKHISYVMMFLEDVELLSFGLHPHFYKHMPEWAQYVANPLSYRPPRYEDYLIIFGVVVGAITLALASAAKVAFSFESGKFAGASLFALKSLRILTKLLGSVLLMPAVEILLSAIACVGPGRTLIEYPMVQCFEGGYAAETVLAIIFILVYIPFVLLMSAIYVDSKPSTDSVTARVTISRIETIYSTMRIIMSATFTLSEDPRLLLIVAVVLIGSLCYLMVTNQPFYKQELNMFRCGVYTASFFAILVAGVSYLSDSDSKIFPIITIVSIPVGFVVGAIACKVWYRRILRRVYSRLHQKKDAMKDVMVGLDGNIIYKSSKMHDMEKAEYGEGGNDIFDNIKDITSTRTRPKTIKVFRCPAEVEISARYMHNNRTPDALMIMEEIFAEGFRQFPRNSMLYLIFAEYLEAYAPFNEQEPVFYIRKAKSLHPPLDARFFIFMLDRYSEQSKRTEGLNSSTLNISSYVEFQTMQTGARRSHLACLMEQRAFLTHIRSHQRGRDPKTYPIFLQRFSEAERKATDYYKKLITRWPKSKVLLRMYATFLIQVKSDREGAQKYMSVAEDIEEVETQMLTTAARNESRRASLMNFRHASPNASTARSLPLNQNENFVRYSLGQNDKAKTAASSLRGSKTSLRDTIVGSTQMEPTVSIVLEESPSHLMIRPDMHPPPDVDEDLLHSGSTKLPAVSDIIFVENDRSDGSMHRRGPPSLGVVSQKGVGFSRSTRPVDDDDEDDDDEHEKRAEFNAPSESVPSTRSSEREERRKLHCKTQLQSRLKAPVVVLDLRQKIAVTIFIGIAIATIVVGLWSFQQTESSLAVFSRLTRLSRAGTVTAQYIRHLSQAPYIPATQLTLYNTTFVQASTNLDSIMINFTTYYLPYLTAFYNEKEAAGLKVSNHPNPIKSIKYFNTFESTKLLSQYGMELANRDSTWWNSTARVTNKQIRFFLDNAVNIGPMYERAVTDAQGAWSESTMANVYILYALASILFVTFFAWAYCILRPMIEETHDEQVRTLKMFALVPKKALMHMLTDVEEQIETIADEMAQAPGANRSENADAEGQEGAGAHAFKQIMNTTIDSDELILKHAPRKHTMRYLLGLLLLIAPAMGLLIAPIYRAMLSVTYAVTMNFINSRRYLAQAVLMLAYEVIWFDAASWLPYEPLTYYRDRLDQLVLLHAKAVMGIDCIATATIAQLSQFTLYDAPCQPACGNLTMGLDRQIEWFITKANTFYDTAVNNTVSFTNANLNTMYQLVPSIVDNVNTMDIMFENLITNSNSDAKLAMIVLFVAILLITIGVYFICLRATALHRLQEMDSAVTLLFGIPDTVMTQVPEIKRFIDSGGMFADDGGIRKKR